MKIDRDEHFKGPDLMITPKVKAAFLTVLYLSVLVPSLAASVSRTQAQEPAPAKADSEEDERWLMAAPGRVEPASGEIRIVAPVVGVVGEVLVKANDTVFAGEPLIRLTDKETKARLAAAEVQVALRKRVRNDEISHNQGRRASQSRGCGGRR